MYDFTRNKNVITDNRSGRVTVLESINKAKATSRKAQREGYTVNVIPHITKPQCVSYVKPWRPDNAD